MKMTETMTMQRSELVGLRDALQLAFRAVEDAKHREDSSYGRNFSVHRAKTVRSRYEMVRTAIDMVDAQLMQTNDDVV